MHSRESPIKEEPHSIREVFHYEISTQFLEHKRLFTMLSLISNLQYTHLTVR
jgi:hypothetical protein